MLTDSDIQYILEHLPEDDSIDGQNIKKKLDILHNQMTLQSEFRERSLELQKQMDEVNKIVVK
jgi:hypothetical protein